MKLKKILLTVFLFILCTAGIAVVAYWPTVAKKPVEHHRTRVITPVVSSGSGQNSVTEYFFEYDGSYHLKANLDDGDLVISVLDYDFFSTAFEDQVVVYRSTDQENAIFLTYIGFNENTGAYRRLWNAPVAATMPATVSMYTIDILGDRSVSIIVTGMNSLNEHTMTVIRVPAREEQNNNYEIIADIRIDGSITVLETERSLAYRQGIARGQPFFINANGLDNESSNIADRVEIIYSYTPGSRVYERSRLTRIPGAQIEQQRLREVLTGNPRVLEDFIQDLWYHVNPDGTLDRNQYIYFDPSKREIIFYSDNSQQVYRWQSSSSTRIGLYITSQNISVSTLRRLINLDMASPDSIRLKVFEDVRIKISINDSWDGLYRRAGSAAVRTAAGDTTQPFVEAVFDSLTGRISFFSNGEYEFNTGGQLSRGRYIFFQASGSNLLEIRPEPNTPSPFERHLPTAANNGNRFVYHITAQGRPESTGRGGGLPTGTINLSRVRLGVTGFQDLYEGRITLTRVTM